MSYQTIKAAVTDSVGVITLNRPDAMNALSEQMMHEVIDVLDEYEADDNVRVIMLTGNEKAFAAGADIKQMVDQTYLEAYNTQFLGGWDRVAECRKPTMAAVAGYALGGGCEVAMMCDIIVAADTAQFGQPEIKIGTMPGLGGTQRLARAIGKAKAMDMCLTGRMMDVHEAERAGLVSRIVPAAELLEQAMKMAVSIAQKSRPVVALTKECINAGINTTLDQGMRIERRAFYSLFGTEDQKEGMSAFVEKRKPTFS